MPRKKVRYLVVILGGYLLAQNFVCNPLFASDDDNAQAKKLSGHCKTCHGSDGIARIPIAPNIAGEPETYLINQLIAFKTGRREHEMMNVVTKNLDEEGIELLSKWYAGIKINAKLQSEQEPKPIVKKCIECHGTDGIAITENTPHLAGESVIYIDTQLKAFRNGKRKHEIMSQIAAKLTDSEIRDIAEWYSDIDFTINE